MELTIEQRIRAVLGHELALPDEEIHTDARIKEDLGADSGDSYSLVLALEEEFSIEIQDQDLSELRTVRHLVDYISARAGSATP